MNASRSFRHVRSRFGAAVPARSRRETCKGVVGDSRREDDRACYRREFGGTSKRGRLAAALLVATLPVGCEPAGWVGTVVVLLGTLGVLVAFVLVIVDAVRKKPVRVPAIAALACVVILVGGFATIGFGLTDEERTTLKQKREQKEKASRSDDATAEPRDEHPKRKENALRSDDTTVEPRDEHPEPKRAPGILAPGILAPEPGPEPPPTEAAPQRAPVEATPPAEDKPGGDKISAEFFCERLNVLQKLGGGLGHKKAACVEGKKPEEATPEFQELARCLLDSRRIEDYRGTCLK